MKKLCQIFEEYIIRARLKLQKTAVLVLFSICLASFLFSWFAINRNQIPMVLTTCVKFAITIPMSFFAILSLLTLVLGCTPSKLKDIIVKKTNLLAFIEKISLYGFYGSYLLLGIFVCCGGLYLINHFSYPNLFMFLFILLYLVSIQVLMSVVTLFLLASLNTMKQFDVNSLRALLIESLLNFTRELSKELLKIIDPKTLFLDLRKFFVIPIMAALFISWNDGFLYFNQLIGSYFLPLMLLYLFFELAFSSTLAKISSCNQTRNQRTTGKNVNKNYRRITIGYLIALNRKLVRFSNFLMLSVFVSFLLLSIFYCILNLKFNVVMSILNQISALFVITLGYSIASQALSHLILITHINGTKVKIKK